MVTGTQYAFFGRRGEERRRDEQQAGEWEPGGGGARGEFALQFADADVAELDMSAVAEQSDAAAGAAQAGVFL